jgi:hypothetical protein
MTAIASQLIPKPASVDASTGSRMLHDVHEDHDDVIVTTSRAASGATSMSLSPTHRRTAT